MENRRIEYIICINTLRLRQNGRHFFSMDIFKCVVFKQNIYIPNKVSLEYGPKGPMNNIPTLVEIIAWRLG